MLDTVWMYVRRRSSLQLGSFIFSTIVETSCPRSLSDSVALSEAIHAIDRLRAAARAEPSSSKSALRHASASSSFRLEPKRRSRSSRICMHSSFTSRTGCETPLTSLLVSWCTATDPCAVGISSTIVFRPIAAICRRRVQTKSALQRLRHHTGRVLECTAAYITLPVFAGEDGRR